MKCTVCGTENPDNARFCGICGNPFADSATASTEINSSIPDATITDTNAEEAPAESNVADESNEPCIDPSPSAIPAVPSPNENADVNASDGRPSVQAAPMPLPNAPKRSVFSNSGLGSAFNPSDNAAPHSKSNVSKHGKEKKVVSLSVAVFCIVAVFILAVICGILTQLYTRKIRSTANSGTAYSSSKTSDEANIFLECIF